MPALAQVIDAAYREQLLARSPTLPREQLELAIAAVYAELQSLFAELEGERLEGSWRRELWDAQAQPLLALPGRRELAKQLQIEAASGRPLTVCFGKRARQLPAPLGTQVFSTGDGCGLVHPDSIGVRRPSFRSYCQRCRQQETTRRQTDLAASLARWQGREPVLIFEPSTGRHLAAWLGSCGNCGNDFVSTDLRVRRCQPCRAGHR